MQLLTQSRAATTPSASGWASVPLGIVTASAAAHLALYRLSTLAYGRSSARAVRFLQHWSVRACRRLRIGVELHGTPVTTPCLYVANHRSYLDIPVLSAALGMSFMSRADVSRWRIVGAAARDVQSVFVERDDLHGRARAARALARRLATGSVVVFPEGTTHGERLPHAFHPGTFRLVHRLGLGIVPVTIRYSDRRAYWIDDIPLVAHLRERVLAGPPLGAAVHVGEPLDDGPAADGPSLADAARRAVSRPIEELGELA